jgi:hypothetical protein
MAAKAVGVGVEDDDEIGGTTGVNGIIKEVVCESLCFTTFLSAPFIISM